MTIEHLAIWTHDLERLKAFYERYFHARSGEKYINPVKKFESYFLSFDNGPRLEIMYMPGIPAHTNDVYRQFTGLIHFAMMTSGKDEVNRLTEELRAAGYAVVGEPRTTGDGYYESVILDPDGNRVEIMA